MKNKEILVSLVFAVVNTVLAFVAGNADVAFLVFIFSIAMSVVIKIKVPRISYVYVWPVFPMLTLFFSYLIIKKYFLM